MRAGWEKPGKGFVTDFFIVGAAGEVWMIDRIRIWAAPDAPPGQPLALGDLYQSFTLHGGLEALPEEAQCACHGLAALKTASLLPGQNSPQNSDIRITPAGQNTSLWQVDFHDLRWSVPGGMHLRFGVMAVGRPQPGGVTPVWFTRTSPGSGEHHLWWFDAEGKPLGALAGTSRFDVQVWAHLSGHVASPTEKH